MNGVVGSHQLTDIRSCLAKSGRVELSLLRPMEAWYFRRKVMRQFLLSIFDAWVGLCPGLVENRSVDSEDGNPWQDLV